MTKRRRRDGRMLKPKPPFKRMPHRQVRIKAGTPINARTWSSIGPLPEGHVGTATDRVLEKGLVGFLRVVWSGHEGTPTIIKSEHLEEIA